VVVKDRAGPHLHSAQDVFYSYYNISRHFWPGNSPDLNTIEPCWMWLKWETTKNGLPRTREEAKELWKNAWEGLP
jgi:transposase